MEIIYAGTVCSKEEDCKVWWLPTIDNKSYEAEVTIPYKDVPGKTDINKENFLDDMLRNSIIRLKMGGDKKKWKK